MLWCPHCSMLSTILFSIGTPDCGLIQAQQYWTILLTIFIVDNINVGSTTLFKAVFINPEQVVRFYACSDQTFSAVITKCFGKILPNWIFYETHANSGYILVIMLRARMYYFFIPVHIPNPSLTFVRVTTDLNYWIKLLSCIIEANGGHIGLSHINLHWYY